MLCRASVVCERVSPAFAGFHEAPQQTFHRRDSERVLVRHVPHAHQSDAAEQGAGAQHRPRSGFGGRLWRQCVGRAHYVVVGAVWLSFSFGDSSPILYRNGPEWLHHFSA